MAVGIDAVLTTDYDIQLDEDGDILTEDSFDTAIKMSLMCDARADASEVPDSHRRRGWVGDVISPESPIGSKLWLYTNQGRVTGSILRGIERVASDALQWLIDDNYAVDLKARAAYSGESISITIEIQRPSGVIEKRLYTIWENTGT